MWLFEQLWDQADQFLVLRPSERREATCRCTLYVEGLLGAASCVPVVTVGPGCMERREGGPHKDVVDVETMGVMATRELLVSLCPPGWS